MNNLQVAIKQLSCPHCRAMGEISRFMNGWEKEGKTFYTGDVFAGQYQKGEEFEAAVLLLACPACEQPFAILDKLIQQWKIVNSLSGAEIEYVCFPERGVGEEHLGQYNPWGPDKALAAYAIIVPREAEWLPDPQPLEGYPKLAWQTNKAIFRSPGHPLDDEGENTEKRFLYGYFDGDICLSQHWLTEAQAAEQQELLAAPKIVQMLRDDCYMPPACLTYQGLNAGNSALYSANQ